MPRLARMTTAERAALLRAARDKLQVLERDLEMWDRRLITDRSKEAKAQRDVVKDEHALLSEAIRKTWLGVTSDG